MILMFDNDGKRGRRIILSKILKIKLRVCFTNALSVLCQLANLLVYNIPCAIIALATFMKPAILAPFT